MERSRQDGNLGEARLYIYAREGECMGERGEQKM